MKKQEERIEVNYYPKDEAFVFAMAWKENGKHKAIYLRIPKKKLLQMIKDGEENDD